MAQLVGEICHTQQRSELGIHTPTPRRLEQESMRKSHSEMRGIHRNEKEKLTATQLRGGPARPPSRNHGLALHCLSPCGGGTSVEIRFNFIIFEKRYDIVKGCVTRLKLSLFRRGCSVLSGLSDQHTQSQSQSFQHIVGPVSSQSRQQRSGGTCDGLG